MGPVPKRLGELYDLLGYMVLSGPELKSTFVPEQGVESMFADLDAGLLNLRRVLGEGGFSRLVDASAEAKALYMSRNHMAGNRIIQHMGEYIRLKKFKTQEPVVDEARFEPQ
jgi:hypothetical protein